MSGCHSQTPMSNGSVSVPLSSLALRALWLAGSLTWQALWLAGSPRLARHDRETGADLLPKGEEGRRRRRTTGCRAMRPPARLTPLDRDVRCAVAWRHDAPCQHSFIRGLLALVMSHLKNNSSAATFQRGCGRSAVATLHPSPPLWAACLLDTVPPYMIGKGGRANDASIAPGVRRRCGAARCGAV